MGMAFKRKRSGQAGRRVKRRRSSRRSGGGLAKKIRQIAMRNMETKQYFYNTGAPRNLVSDVPLTFNLNYYIGQGTTDSTRIGDEIFLNHFKVRLYFQTQTATSATQMYRVMIIKTRTEANLTSLTYGDIFKNASGSFLTDLIDDEKVTVIKSRMIRIVPQVSSTVIAQTVYMTKRMKNVRFRYNGDNAGYGKSHNYYLVIMGMIQGGTTGVATAGTVAGNVIIGYKDA